MDPHLSAPELRVLGALIEKSVTTPDNYPLSLNALTAACNQTSNRSPVVQYDEVTVSEAIASLRHRNLVHQILRSDSRVTKYEHVAERELALDAAELAAMCVLMLRGTQTTGEIRTRAARLHDFPDLPATEATLERLVGRALVARLARQPGQKEGRYVQLLGATADAGERREAGSESSAEGLDSTGEWAAGVSDRVGAIEAAVEALQGEVDELKARLDELRRQLE